MSKRFFLPIFILVLGSSFWYFFLYEELAPAKIGLVQKLKNDFSVTEIQTAPNAETETASIKIIPAKETLPDIPAAEPVAMEIPQEVKALYVTASTAFTPYLLNNIIDLIGATELNALVINIKDGNRVYLNQKMADIAKELKEKGIYPIARLVIFQDNYLAQKRPDLALKTKAGFLWERPGWFWVDPASQEVWDYNAEIAVKALEMGFLEINFDYIRFPDGSLEKIIYPFYQENKLKTDVINEASAYMTSRIKEKYPEAVISLDIFAYSFLRNHGLGVGQKLIEMADYFDVISPMIYPSHYASGNFGFENPAAEPYQVTLQTLQSGNWQLVQAGKEIVIRPWIQDFDMGAVYDRQMLQEEIRAIKDAGLNNGWMAWNPYNLYSYEKYKKEDLLQVEEEIIIDSIPQ